MFKFEIGSLFFVHLNAGSQISKIGGSHIYEKSRSQSFMLKFETGSLFFVCLKTGSSRWEVDIKFSKEPDL